MVYGGKPSAGCPNCRKRKIKCDEARPACIQCVKTRRICPGYRKPFDLVLRDQNQITRDKVQRRQSRRDASALPESSDSTTPEPADETHVVTLVKSTSPSPVPTKLFTFTPEDVATCMFFSNFVYTHRHPQTGRGYIDALTPLYNDARPGSLLWLAVDTVALAIYEGSRNFRGVYGLAQKTFGKALTATQTAVRDPVESLKDETLLAVLLLSLFERVQATFESSTLSCVHDAGATALIKHRGKDINTRSPIATTLLYAVYTQVVDRAMEESLPPGNNVTICAELAAEVPQNTAARLTPLCAELAGLRSDARRIIVNPMYESEILSILNHALDMDNQFVSWATTVPEDWYWSAADHFDIPPGMSKALFVYQDRMDVYYDIHVAGVWNHYRASRLKTLMIIFDCVNALGPAFPDPLHGRKSAFINEIQILTDGICGTVPLMLGTRTNIVTQNPATVEYPYIKNENVRGEHRRAAGAVGGWMLIEPHNQPLKTAAEMPYIREGQRDWIFGQLGRILNSELYFRSIFYPGWRAP